MSALVPPELLDGVIRHLDPVEVWLFGSRARGDHRPDSDWDLYVVVEDGAEASARNARTGATDAYRRRAGVGVDVIIKPWSQSLARRRAFGTLDEIIDHEGRRVFARERMPMVQDVPEVNSPAEWLKLGRGDARMAKFAITEELLGHSSFPIQQAWEKALKGQLAFAGIRVRKTHALNDLAESLGGFSPAEVARLAAVSKWSIEGRYGAYPDNDIATLEAELARAMAALDALEAAVRASAP